MSGFSGLPVLKAFGKFGIGFAAILGGCLTTFAADQPLVFHAEVGSDRRVVWTEDGDRSFNPASVVKVGTSLLALNKLGPYHRYLTDFACLGVCSIEGGRLNGDLLIIGAADPDFQAENAWLVAHELGKLGISKVSGDLVIDGIFYQGWEHGVEKRQTDVALRARLMGGRFQQALDVSKWNQTLFATWEDAAPRQGWPMDAKPRIVFEGSVRQAGCDSDVSQPLVQHRSNPLVVTLQRFNTFSNNDIIRVADPIGGTVAIEALLKAVTDGLPGEIKISTASGERVNRMTARQVIKLLWAFEDTCGEFDLDLGDILPIPGCVPGSLPRMFPRLADGEFARTSVVKSGTLTNTDGGVAVLAGIFRTVKGENVAFCVAAPQAGGRIKAMRLKEQDWLLDLMGSVGGVSSRSCATPLAFSDTMADARVTRKPGAENTNGDSDATK